MLRVDIQTTAKAKRYRQIEIAKEAGLTRATINKYWLGNVKLINLDTLSRIAKVLNVPAKRLLVEEDE